MVESKGERRKYPRISDDKISMKVKSSSGDIITRSVNISASGIYCKSDLELPPMSRLGITLVLPSKTNKPKAMQKIETEGVVVREHPVIIDNKINHYDVAIFFDNLRSRERELINQYIESRL